MFGLFIGEVLQQRFLIVKSVVCPNLRLFIRSLYSKGLGSTHGFPPVRGLPSALSVYVSSVVAVSQSNNCSLFFWTDDQDILLPIIEPSDHRDAGPQILDHWLEAQEEQLAAGSHHTRFFYATEPSKLHPSCQLQLDSGDQSYLSTVQIDWYRFALIRCFHCYSCPKSGG